MTAETCNRYPLLVPYTLPRAGLSALIPELFDGYTVLRPVQENLPEAAAALGGRLRLAVPELADAGALNRKLASLRAWAASQGTLDAQRLRHEPEPPPDDTRVSAHEIRKWIEGEAPDTAPDPREDGQTEAALLLMLAEQADLEADALQEGLARIDSRAADFFKTLSDPDADGLLPDAYRNAAAPSAADPATRSPELAGDRLAAWKRLFSALPDASEHRMLVTDSIDVWESFTGSVPSPDSGVTVQPSNPDHAAAFRDWIKDMSAPPPPVSEPADDKPVYLCERAAISPDCGTGTALTAVLYLIRPYLRDAPA